MKKKKNIAFLVGGYSGEFEISLKSAQYIESQLVSLKYQFYRIVISESKWYYDSPTGRKIKINKDDFSIKISGQKITFDAAFILIHGTPGEDGLIQAYLDLMNIPYPSCNHLSSTITFDKKLTNTIAHANGIPVARSVLLHDAKSVSTAKILKKVSLPVFVKPNQGGSSLGTFKVTKKKDLEVSIEKAFGVDDGVLVEEFIPGRELTIGVVRWKGEIVTFPISEIIAPNEFFDFDAKYSVGGCEEITPANISQKMKLAVEKSAIEIYKLFDCYGVVRVDYIWHQEAKKPYFLEVNTIPGLTETSFIPQQLAAMKWSPKKVYIGLIDEILKKK